MYYNLVMKGQFQNLTSRYKVDLSRSCCILINGPGQVHKHLRSRLMSLLYLSPIKSYMRKRYVTS